MFTPMPASFRPFDGLHGPAMDLIVASAFARQSAPAEDVPDAPRLGQRVRLRHDVERGNGWVIPKGSTGTVVIAEADEISQLISVRMDAHFPDLDSWDNELYWVGEDHYDAEGNNVGLYAAVPFWEDCSRIVKDIANLSEEV